MIAGMENSKSNFPIRSAPSCSAFFIVLAIEKPSLFYLPLFTATPASVLPA
jgi:hypothetical protein